MARGIEVRAATLITVMSSNILVVLTISTKCRSNAYHFIKVHGMRVIWTSLPVSRRRQWGGGRGH